MNKQNWVMLLLALALMCGTASLLRQIHTHQRLGPPGVKTSPLADGDRLRVDLPESVLDWKSEPVEVDKIVLGVLPKDTSFGQRRYTAPDGFETMVNVVLMGGDRTSHHKPQFCLEGTGWHIDSAASTQTTVRMERPLVYDLPVVKLIVTKEVKANGRSLTARGVYVYWYVADGEISASMSGVQRMWWMARDLARSGVLQRWAYITCFSVCYPGQEQATFERMKGFIAASVPEFQLAPRPAEPTVTARR